MLLKRPSITAAAYVCNRRLFVTADRERVVEDGDPDGAFLLAAEGGPISAEDVQRYGLQDAVRPNTAPPDAPPLNAYEEQDRQRRARIEAFVDRGKRTAGGVTVGKEGQ